MGGGGEEDTEEFLSCILDGMHEEMSAAVTLLNKNDKAGQFKTGMCMGGGGWGGFREVPELYSRWDA